MGYGYRSMSMYILFLQPWGGARDGGRKKWAGRGSWVLYLFQTETCFLSSSPLTELCQKEIKPLWGEERRRNPHFSSWLYVCTHRYPFLFSFIPTYFFDNDNNLMDMLLLERFLVRVYCDRWLFCSR